MQDFSQFSAGFSQMRNFFVNEALTTAQQVQTGAAQIRAQQQQLNSQQPVVVTRNVSGPASSGGLFWFGMGSIATLVVAYYLWRKGE